jgi:glucose dehydrogenase
MARCFRGTIDGHLIALDAASGQPRADFGSSGQIDLLAAAAPYGGTPYGPHYLAGQMNVTSPPAMINDLVVVGAAIGDNIAVVQQRGVMQAFDARMGTKRWDWDPTLRNPGDPGYETWQGPLARGNQRETWGERRHPLPRRWLAAQ